MGSSPIARITNKCQCILKLQLLQSTLQLRSIKSEMPVIQSKGMFAFLLMQNKKLFSKTTQRRQFHLLSQAFSQVLQKFNPKRRRTMFLRLKLPQFFHPQQLSEGLPISFDGETKLVERPFSALFEQLQSENTASFKNTVNTEVLLIVHQIGFKDIAHLPLLNL